MKIRFVLVILTGAIILFLASLFANPPPTTPQNVSLPAGGDNQISNGLLENTVQAALEGTQGTYGIVIKNLKTGEGYSINEDKVFDSGSLYKLWVMAAAFNQLQAGVWEEDQVFTEDVATLNAKFDIDPDLVEQTAGVVIFNVHDALEQMITISHNYAALLLMAELKVSTVKAFLEENGLKQSAVGTEESNFTTTPTDTALFFEKLYRGELANKENTDKMLGLLKRQQLNDKLPRYLPPETVVAHKTGELGWFCHDAGIVYSPQGDYVIVVLSESSSPLGAEDRIAQVSKAVYDYFENKNE